jgi:hypothetical protein
LRKSKPGLASGTLMTVPRGLVTFALFMTSLLFDWDSYRFTTHCAKALEKPSRFS